LKTFFEKILKLDGGRSDNTERGMFDSIGSVLSTHPDTKERISEIKPLPAGVKAKPSLTDPEWQALKKICG
jgi:beta-barrel assembly-enhancing protease